MSTYENILKWITVYYPLKPILMLSHMRANTSVLGHVMGSNPEINGYYEMHIGYYSWKSFYRQKLKYLEEHRFKKNSKYIFDKILHNEHSINTELLLQKSVITLISVREPTQTIKSIIKLYEKVDNKHEFATISGAEKYYRKRLEQLIQYAEQLSGHYIYLNADMIRNDTDSVLIKLSDAIGLNDRLRAEYDTHALTGVGASGDHSPNLKKGIIMSNTQSYDDVILDDKLKDELHNLYADVESLMISEARFSI